MATGTIKKIVADRGFGFIQRETGEDLFFHRSAVTTSFDSLSEGQTVSYDTITDPRRKDKESATNVTPA